MKQNVTILIIDPSFLLHYGTIKVDKSRNMLTEPGITCTVAAVNKRKACVHLGEKNLRCTCSFGEKISPLALDTEKKPIKKWCTHTVSIFRPA